MTPESVLNKICDEFSGVVPKPSWGETSLFYNPRKLLPNGVYFCTIKEKDGENDKASDLNRENMFSNLCLDELDASSTSNRRNV